MESFRILENPLLPKGKPLEYHGTSLDFFKGNSFRILRVSKVWSFRISWKSLRKFRWTPLKSKGGPLEPKENRLESDGELMRSPLGSQGNLSES